MQILKFIFILATIVIACASLTFSQEVKTVKIVRQPVMREFNAAFKGKPEQEIESLEHQLADAVRLTDGVKLEALLADGVLIAGLIADKKQFIAFLKAVDTKYFSIEKSEMRIQMNGDTAVATGIQKTDIDIDNGSRFSQSVFINTWKHIDGVWRCIAFAG